MKKISVHTEPQLYIFNTVEQLTSSLANALVAEINKCILQKGECSIALSGGNTPKQLYTLLGAAPLKNSVSWEYVFFFWSDERCVPANDPRSNAHMARTTLLDKLHIPMANINAVQTEPEPELAARAYEQTILDFFEQGETAFDIMLLGLGTDCHTASLFPHSPALHEKEKLAVAVYDSPDKLPRVSMTFTLINKAHTIIFLAEGSSKAEAVKRVLKDKESIENAPAKGVKPHNGKLFWYLDKQAASLLSV